jgi:pimeloyl-ACP methyl ester carboxylesterase
MLAYKTINLTALQLHYVETDEPGIPALLLHCALESHESYLTLFPELAAIGHIYALDLRGHGQSGRATGAYQVHHHVQDLHEFIQRVIGRPAVVIGHSLGGAIAAWYAAQYPDWVHALIDEDSDLLDPPDQPYPHFAVIRDTLFEYKAAGKSLVEFEQRCAQDVYRDNKTRLELFGWEAVRRHARLRWQMDPHTLDPVIDGTLLAGYIPENVLPRISCPTHLIYRRGQEENVQHIAALIPQCTYTIVNTDDHRVHETQPEEYLGAVKQFIQRVTPSYAH